ncbi:MAG: hypothetical protein IKP81_07955 [Paludibacteraceae bacterium]|nr:hypothetical protein [Paludibacteraceae bacterium]
MLIRGFSNVLSFCLLVSTGSLVACGGSRSDKTDGVAETQSLEGPRKGKGIKKSAKSERFTSDGKNGERHRPNSKANQTDAETFYYDGRIVDDEVNVRLLFQGKQVSGFVKRIDSGKKTNVSGSLDDDGNILLTEYSQSQKVGRLVGTRHRRKRRFSGEYSSVNGSTGSFKFSKTSPHRVVDDIYQ